jgi:hypothetical protein
MLKMDIYPYTIFLFTVLTETRYYPSEIKSNHTTSHPPYITDANAGDTQWLTVYIAILLMHVNMQYKFCNK